MNFKLIEEFKKFLKVFVLSLYLMVDFIESRLLIVKKLNLSVSCVLCVLLWKCFLIISSY